MSVSALDKIRTAPTDRLNYRGNLTPVVENICRAYDLGMLQGFSVIEVGYEDCNVLVKAAKGEFIAKMFNKTRTLEEIERNMRIMREVIEVGVQHPPLVLTNNGDDVFSTLGVTLTLMNFISGKTFFELNRAPNRSERKAILEQAAKIHQINLLPAYTFDSWAIPHIHGMYERVKRYIDPVDMPLVERAIVKYDAIPIQKLPRALVHGDFTKANIIKASNGHIYIIDFSETNIYPRIQELAVIVANLLYEPGDKWSLKDRCDIVASEYGCSNKLTDEELRYLPDYALAGVAMEFMGAHQEKYVNGVDTPETEYWMQLGRDGLRTAAV